MNKSTTAIELSNSQKIFMFTVDCPSMCPHCGLAIDPIMLSSNFIRYENEDDFDAKVFVHFFCNNCLKSFCSEYGVFSFLDEHDRNDTEFIETYPTYHSTPKHPNEISKLSPKYIKIYDESLFAEECGLNEICGMGYRKAIEFLIKDYAIKTHPESEETIKSSLLSTCINNYVDSSRIKTLALASAWIGNDETHYVRKHEDYNLNSLKSFINAVESYINSEMEAIKAESLIRPQK